MDKLPYIYGIIAALILLFYILHMDKIKTNSYTAIIAAALIWPVFVIFIPMMLFEEWMNRMNE